MKKVLISFFLTLTLVSSVYAGGRSTPRVESIVNPTISGFTVNAYSVPAFTGNREWSIRFSSTTNIWYEIKDISAVKSRTDSTPAPRNCTESSDLDCAIRITDYQLRDNQIKCGTRYSVVFRVTSLDQPNTRADSPPVIVNTPSCSQTGILGVEANLTQKDDSTMTLTARANISGFSGEQEAEFFFGIKEGDSQSVQITDYQSLGKKSGLSSIVFTADIPDLDCEKKYVYKTKVKIGDVETFTPSGTGVYRTGNTFECSTSLGTGEDEDETEGDNRYVFLTPLPFNDGLNPQESVIIGATGEDGILGILQRIFTLMLVAAVVLAVVFMIIGGARYATGDTLGGVQGGRQIITNAVTGLLFALLAWLLLNVINPDLLRFTLVIPNVGSKLTPGTGDTVGTNGDSPCAGLTDEECFDKIAEDEQNVRDRFDAEEIKVVGTSSGERPCEAFDESGCTMVGLLSNSMITKLIEVKRDCVAANPNCEMQITGGTEYWNHGRPPEYNGNHKRFVAVDLQLTGNEYAPLKNFIEGKTKIANPFNLCVDTYSYKGLRFCNESRNHWHVDLSAGSGGGGSTNGGLIKFENIGKNNLGVYGKASRQPITPSDVDTLVTSARSKSWYPEVQRIAGSNAKILTAIIMVESSGDPDKVRTEPDGRKSCGLGQLLTDTAKSLDSTLRTKSVDEICTALKDPSYNIRLSNQHYRSLTGDFKTKVAAYNGGSCVQRAGEPDCRGGATGVSANCNGLMRFECPWDSDGCYDQTKPNDRPSNTSCQVNTGYEVTRFYVDKVKKISDEL